MQQVKGRTHVDLKGISIMNCLQGWCVKEWVGGGGVSNPPPLFAVYTTLCIFDTRAPLCNFHHMIPDRRRRGRQFARHTD
jgi:hypothetical protein